MKIERPWLRIIVSVIVAGIVGFAVYAGVVVVGSRWVGAVAQGWYVMFFLSIFLTGPIVATVLAHVLSPREKKDGHTRCGKGVKKIWVRRTGRAKWVGTAIALLSFPSFLVTLPFLIDWLSWTILDYDLIDYLVFGFGIAEDVTTAFLIASIVILSYLAARLLYACMIFQRVLDETPRCDGCGYNLTGNRSGRCPECGERI